MFAISSGWSAFVVLSRSLQICDVQIPRVDANDERSKTKRFAYATVKATNDQIDNFKSRYNGKQTWCFCNECVHLQLACLVELRLATVRA